MYKTRHDHFMDVCLATKSTQTCKKFVPDALSVDRGSDAKKLFFDAFICLGEDMRMVHYCIAVTLASPYLPVRSVLFQCRASINGTLSFF